MSTPPAPPPGSASPSVPGPRVVLIVEDEEPIAQALTYVVEDAGYAALVAPMVRRLSRWRCNTGPSSSSLTS